MYKIIKQEKSTGRRWIQTRSTEEEAEVRSYINSLLTEYESQKTKEMQEKHTIQDNMYYSKQYYYYCIKII